MLLLGKLKNELSVTGIAGNGGQLLSFHGVFQESGADIRKKIIADNGVDKTGSGGDIVAAPDDLVTKALGAGKISAVFGADSLFNLPELEVDDSVDDL